MFPVVSMGLIAMKSNNKRCQKTRGLLITFEGIDGCGKTTQVEMLQHRFKENAVPNILVREPGGTAVGEEIRQILLHNQCSLSLHTELLLYMAARSELYEQLIRPGILAGKIVVCDRFTDSTLAYQGYGGGADLDLIRLLNKKATGGIAPDLTFLLDLTVEEAAGRRRGKADRMENKNYCYHQRVKHGYLEIARQEQQRLVVIDASEDRTRQGDKIWKIIQDLIGKHYQAGADHER